MGTFSQSCRSDFQQSHAKYISFLALGVSALWLSILIMAYMAYVVKFLCIYSLPFYHVAVQSI